ncbi:MAG: DUF2239 family protein [Rhodobacteraceae bacterium]|nr:DUF2239 family protein [Paracoccaceae bacterium]
MDRPLIAFEGDRRIGDGPAATLRDLLRARLAARPDPAHGPRLAVFDAETGRPVDFDLRETAPPPAARGRPKLGVTAREVTLLPRHWDWLATQPGGASATLRRLVETASRTQHGVDRVRQGREAAYRILTDLAGDRPGYEEAMRALFAGDAAGFARHTEGWPHDIRATGRALGFPDPA